MKCSDSILNPRFFYQGLDIIVGIRYNGIRAMKDNPAALLPLSPATLHVLLALAGEDLHGYGIMQEVLRQSEGCDKLGPGTLYDNLQRLTAQGMVQETGRGTGTDTRAVATIA
jgi:hypothetical protein